MEKGGTIPKTGPYRLHKGELVIPKDEVDDELVSTLIRRKLNERAGKTLGDYQGGSLEDLFRLAEAGDVPAFREILRSQGMSDSEITKAITSVNRGPGGRMVKGPAKAENIKNFLRKSAPAAGTAMRDTPKPPGWLGSVVPLGGIGLGAYGLSRMGGEPTPEPTPRAGTLPGRLAEKLPRWLPYLGAGGAAPGLGLRTLEGLLAGKGLPRAASAAVRKQVLGAADVGGEALYGALQGITGEEEPLLPAPPVPSGPPEGRESLEEVIGGLAGVLGPGGPPEGTYEAAAARTRAGDFGTPEKPLVLRGELSDIEQAQRDVEALPMYQEAKRKSDKAEREAEMIFSLLEREGRALAPEVYSDLYSEGERKMKLADRFRQITERKEKATEAFLATTSKNLQGVMRDIIREGAIGDRMQMLEKLRQEGRLELGVVRADINTLPRLQIVAHTGNPRERTEAKESIRTILQRLLLYRELHAAAGDKQKYQGAENQLGDWTERFSAYSQGEAKAMVDALLESLGGQQ